MALAHTTELPEGVKYSAKRADRVVNFVQKATVHTKGSWSGKPFELQDWQAGDVWKNDAGLWQCDGIVRPAFGAVKWSDLHQRYVRNYSLIWLELARKNGKALAISTPVLTAVGWSKMGDLRVGDYVHAIDGSLTRVSHVSDRQTRDTYRVTFADGSDFTASDHHKWLVNDRRLSKTRVVETSELFETQTYGARKDRRYSVDVPAALMRPEADLLIDPYLFGAWLGDGSTYKAEMTGEDPEIFEAFEAAGYQLSYHYQRGNAVTRGIRGMRAQLNQLGVLGGKFVPESYLLASEAQRLELLRGLMDTDGSVIVGPNTPRVEFCNTSRILADAVLFLARSLGWKATLKESRATLNGKDCGPRYRVCWTARADRSPFRLERKTSKLAQSTARKTRANTNAIISVERVSPVEAVCIQVEHTSHVFLVGESLTPTHNSELMAALGVYLLCADGEQSGENFCVAVDRDQASLVYSVARDMIRLSPVLSKELERGNFEIHNSQKRIVHVPTRSTLQVVASDAGGNLGSNPHGVLFDEVLLQHDRQLWDAMEQGFGTRAQSLMIGITTAGPDNDGFASTEHKFGLEVAAEPYKDPTRFVYIAATPEDADWRDESTWYDANPGMFHPEKNPKGFFDISALRKERDRALNSGDLVALANFRIFRLNQWGNSAKRWLDSDVWQDSDAQSPYTEDTIKDLWSFGGLDMAETTDLTSWQLVFVDPETGKRYVKSRHWITRNSMETRHKRRLSQFRRWESEGLLTVFETEVQDYRKITDQILDDIETYKVSALGFDQYQTPQIISEIESKTDVTCVKIPQTTSRMNPGSKELVRALGDRAIGFGGNPLMAWQAGNVVPQVDKDLNVKPSKKDSSDQIDGISALVNALCVLVAMPAEDPVPQFYSFSDEDFEDYEWDD